MEIRRDLLKALISQLKDTCEWVWILGNRCIILEKWLSEERAELNYRKTYPDRPWTALGDERKEWIDRAELQLRGEGKL